MNLGGVRDEDVVAVNVRGDQFYGLVLNRDGRKLNIRPISGGRGEFRQVTARQVVAHYRKSKQSRG